MGIPVLLYGVVIQEAIVSGDLATMRKMERRAEEHLRETGDVAAALKALKVEIAKLERRGR